jgi:hypothetical protein
MILACGGTSMSFRPKVRWIYPSIGIFFIILGFANDASAQKVVGAKSGVIQFSKGSVFLNGNPVSLAKDQYIQLGNSQNLQTTSGYVELILAPSSYLWLGCNSSLRMRQNKLTDIQVEIGQGSAMIEIVKALKNFPIHVYISKSVLEIRKAGLYRFDSATGELRVFRGSVLVGNGKKKTRITEGRMIRLDSQSAPAKFDVQSTDDLHQLAANRSTQLVARMRHSEVEDAMRRMIEAAIQQFNPKFAKGDLQVQAERELQRMQTIQDNQRWDERVRQESETQRQQQQQR